MSITIHFGGKLQSQEKLAELLSFTEYFADDHNLIHMLVEDEQMPLVTMKDGKLSENGTPYSGIIFQPHEKSESLCLFFDEELIMESFCKTQFAGVEAHLLVIEFLEQIKPFFEKFWVEDEGNYWETHDVSLLKQKMDFVSEILDGIERPLKDQNKKDRWKYN